MIHVHRRPQCYLCQSLLCLRCRSHCVVRYGLLLAILPDCLSFHLQGTYRCPFTEPFDGFRSTFGQSSGFTTDVVTRGNFNWNFIRSTFSLTGDVVLGSFTWQVLVHPTSDTQNKEGCSLKGNFLHWAQTSVRCVPKDPLAAQQTARASRPNSRRMETLRLRGLRCMVSDTSCNAFH